MRTKTKGRIRLREYSCTFKPFSKRLRSRGWVQDKRSKPTLVIYENDNNVTGDSYRKIKVPRHINWEYKYKKNI